MYELAREGQGRVDAEPLVRRAQSGDVNAFEAILEQRLTSLFRLAVAILGDEVEARDAVQVACVQAWRELPRLRDVERFDAWLGRILANQCRSSLRSHRRRRVREIPVSHLDPTRGADLVAAAGPGPADQVEEMEIVGRAFRRLSPDARMLLGLHHVNGMNVTEMAARLALPVTTVKWRLHRARAALEQALELERR